MGFLIVIVILIVIMGTRRYDGILGEYIIKLLVLGLLFDAIMLLVLHLK